MTSIVVRQESKRIERCGVRGGRQNHLMAMRWTSSTAAAGGGGIRARAGCRGQTSATQKGPLPRLPLDWAGRAEGTKQAPGTGAGRAGPTRSVVGGVRAPRSLRTNLVCPERRGRGNDSEFRRLLVSTLPGRGARSDLGRPGRAEAERTCSVNRQWSIGAAVRLCGGSRSIAVRRSIGSAVRLCGGSAVRRPSGAAVRSCGGSAVDRSLGQRAGGPVVAARRGESPIADR